MQLNSLYFCGIPIDKASLMYAIKAAKLPMLSLNLCNPCQIQVKSRLVFWLAFLLLTLWLCFRAWRKHQPYTKNFWPSKWIHKAPHWMVRMDDGWLMVFLVSQSIIEEQNTPEKGDNIHRVWDAFSNQAYQVNYSRNFSPQIPKVVWHEGNVCSWCTGTHTK